MFAGPAEEPDGGTPNGLLFQPNGVTQVPQQPPDPYGMYGPKRPGSLNRSSTGSGPFPRLRQVCLPAETLQRFVALAALNTAKKKETLGMLYGRSNAAGGFDITTLLIPKQTSTENTCTMTSEELIVEFQQSRNVVGLGWVRYHLAPCT
jgi:STAM-binding protein